MLHFLWQRKWINETYNLLLYWLLLIDFLIWYRKKNIIGLSKFYSWYFKDCQSRERSLIKRLIPSQPCSVDNNSFLLLSICFVIELQTELEIGVLRNWYHLLIV